MVSHFDLHFLMTNDVEHLWMVCMSSLENTSDF